MADTFLTYTQISETLHSGGNGRNMPRLALRQVCTILQRFSLQYFMFHLGPEPSLFDRSKTNKDPIKIAMDSNGKPDIPSVTVNDNCYAKVLQIALRDYCTAHIRESGNVCHTGIITYLIQGTSLGKRRHASHGPSCVVTQHLGYQKNAIRKAFPGLTHQSSGLPRYLNCWTIGGSVRRMEWTPSFGTHFVRPSPPSLLGPDTSRSPHRLLSRSRHVWTGKHLTSLCPARHHHVINPERRTLMMNFRRYWMKILNIFLNLTTHLHHYHPLLHVSGNRVYPSPTELTVPLHISKRLFHIYLVSSSASLRKARTLMRIGINATGLSVNTHNSSPRTSFIRGRSGRSPVSIPDPPLQGGPSQIPRRSRRPVKLTEKARYALHGHSPD